MDSKTCHKLEDQRRMQFRRAIKNHCEELRLHQGLTDCSELATTAYLSSNRQDRRGAQRTG